MLKKNNFIFLLFFIFAQAQAQSIQQALKINTGFQVPESDVVHSLTKEILHRNNIALIFQVLPNQRSLIYTRFEQTLKKSVTLVPYESQ